MSNMMNRGTAIVGFVLSFVTGAGFMYAVDRGKGSGGEITAANESGKGSTGNGANWKQDAQVPVSSDDPSKGPKSALVTIVEFSDFQ